MLFGGALIAGGWTVVGWGRKSYLGPNEIASFSSWDLSRCNKYDIFGYIVSNGYFYVLFLWAIAAWNFFPLEIYQNLGPPVSSITITLSSHPCWAMECLRYYPLLLLSLLCMLFIVRMARPVSSVQTQSNSSFTAVGHKFLPFSLM